MTSDRENLDWQLFGEASRDLARAIAADGFRPDLILAIARGGLFIAGALGYALAVKNVHVMNVEFYTGEGTTLDMPVMLPPVPDAVDFSQKNVLIADDVADTGKTIELVQGFVSSHVASARTAVIYEKPESAIKCDYVWRRTDSWINFPWSSEEAVSYPPVDRLAAPRGPKASDRGFRCHSAADRDRTKRRRALSEHRRDPPAGYLSSNYLPKLSNSPLWAPPMKACHSSGVKRRTAPSGCRLLRTPISPPDRSATSTQLPLAKLSELLTHLGPASDPSGRLPSEALTISFPH